MIMDGMDMEGMDREGMDIGRVWLWGLGRTFNLVKSNNYPLLYWNVLHNCNKVE